MNRETPEEEQRPGEIPIPAEERLREARSAFDRWSQAMTLRIQRCLPRRWRENPMLLRETGLIEGRAFWRSPLVIAVAAALAMVLFHWTLRLSDLMRVESVGNWVSGHLWLWRAVSILSSALPLWFCACAISRDREPGLRAQLASSRLTLAQVIDAKVKVWLWVLVAMVLLNQVILESIVITGIFLAPEGSVWRDAAFPFDHGMSVTGLLLIVFGQLLLNPIIFIAHHVLRIVLTARFSLAWFNAPLSAALAFFIGWGLMSGPGWVFHLTLPASGIIPPSFSIIWGAVQITCSLVLLVFAIALWRGLPRHFARVYGFAGDQ